MRAFEHLTTGAIGIAIAIVSQQAMLRANDNADCSGGCFLRAQYYPNDYNSMPPDQQYQERQRVYREEAVRNREQFDKQQRESEQGRARRDSHGAIAYSPQSGDYGYSYGQSTRAAAEQRAKRECGKADCEIAAWFESACGALAVGDDGTWAGGEGGTERQARQDALSDCVKDGGKKCAVVYARCSR
jgi:hypothetical protein